MRTHVAVDPPTGPVSGPPVVLCSGLAGNWFDWDACTALLSASRTVVRPDRPGYGLSDPWPDGALPTLESEVTRLRELLDALELPTAVVCGHSMAGFYVEAFARLYPERTAGMLLLDGSVEVRPPWTLPARVRDGLLLRTADAAAAAHINRAGPLAHRLLAGSPAPERFTPILSSEAYLRAALLENGQYPVLARGLSDLRGRKPLRVGLPATVAAAYTGRPTPWAASWLRRQRELADRLGARFAVISPSGHHAMVDQPAQTAALILDVDRAGG